MSNEIKPSLKVSTIGVISMFINTILSILLINHVIQNIDSLGQNYSGKLVFNWFFTSVISAITLTLGRFAELHHKLFTIILSILILISTILGVPSVFMMTLSLADKFENYVITLTITGVGTLPIIYQAIKSWKKMM